MAGNMFDAPYVAMIDSGTFWRCDHGRTRFAKRTCHSCGIRRPVKYVKYGVRQLRRIFAC